MLTCLILPLALFVTPDNPSGPELLEAVISSMSPAAATSVVRQTIETSTGQTRTFEYDSYADAAGEKSLMRYRSPSRVKGNAILTTDFADQIWMYFKRTNRVRKMASHARKQKFEGSDFTYEDMAGGDVWRNDYVPTNGAAVQVQETDCYQLVLTAKSDDQSYSRMVTTVRQSDIYPLQIDYYDHAGVLLKTLYMEDVRLIDGIPTAWLMTMTNHIDKTSTIMEIIEMEYGTEFDKNFFSERNLK